MKHFFTALTLIVFTLPCFAQKEIKEKVYSKYINDTVHYSVLLPVNWSPDQKYTTIYTFTYGASDAAYIADQISYFNRSKVLRIPPTIVVGISTSMDRIGYDYETGLVNSNGLNFISCIKTEIIPSIEHKYNASWFRAYIGHSYAASYGNYLFLQQPDIFNAYMLMAPEKLAPQQPPFELSTANLAFYNKRNTQYFVASGENDIQRRQDYVKEIAKNVQQLDSTSFNFKHVNLLETNHNNIIAQGLPLALGFIYEPYSTFPEVDGTKGTMAAVNTYEKKINALYGVAPGKDFPYYNNYLGVAYQAKDTLALATLVTHFLTKQSSARDMRNFAYYYSMLGQYGKAKNIYQKAIQQLLKKEITTETGPVTLVTCYREMAVNILKDNPQEAWQLLTKALAICTKYKSNVHMSDYNLDIYFFMGQYAVNKNYNTKQGLEYLLLYEKKRKDLVNIIHVNYDRLYYTIGKCYFLLRDTKNAKLYLQKAKEVNAKNKEVLELLQKL